MVLLSPITWPHGFLMLLLPLVLLARRLDGRAVSSLAFACCLVILTARPTWWLFRFETSTATFQHWVPPDDAWLVTTVPLQTYALLGVFVLLVATAISGVRPVRSAGRRSVALE
jgi:hypothetical protein